MGTRKKINISRKVTKQEPDKEGRYGKHGKTVPVEVQPPAPAMALEHPPEDDEKEAKPAAPKAKPASPAKDGE